MSEEETLHLFERCSDVLHTEFIDLDLQGCVLYIYIKIRWGGG